MTPALPHRLESRHGSLLDAAVLTFQRYGFRKTSMEDVAQAAGVSRQGLYLLFSNKEELFRRALTHSLDAQLAAVDAALADSSVCLRPRLIAACLEWYGLSADLMCAGSSLAAATLSAYEARF